VKSIFIGLVGISVLLAFTSTTHAATRTVGNDTSLRPITDTRANFVVVDTNKPSTFNGVLHKFKYYATTKNPFRFLVVDSSSSIKWVSNQITPAVIGLNSFTPTTPVKIKPGWNVGIYFASTGTIPFEYSGKPANYTNGGYGVPVKGNTLSFEGSSNRIYSFEALSNASSDDKGSDRDENHETENTCKNEKRFIETVTIPADKDTDTLSVASLELGTSYILKARGTANAGDSIEFDARYSFRSTSSTAWTDEVSTYESYGKTLLDLLFNGTTPWKEYNASHMYNAKVVGTGAPATFRIYDVYYPNNTGNLYVDIYTLCKNESHDDDEDRDTKIDENHSDGPEHSED
jgi:hypothetical protein